MDVQKLDQVEMAAEGNRMFWRQLLNSADVQHGKLYQLFVTKSKVTYFILRVHTGTCVSRN